MNIKSKIAVVFAGITVLLLLVFGFNWGIKAMAGVNMPAGGLSPGFSYQGYLEERSSPADGIYNFTFEIFDSETGGESFGILEVPDVKVDDGIFTIILEFDPEVFSGEDRWLEIGVSAEGGGEYLILDGRQPITPTP